MKEAFPFSRELRLLEEPSVSIVASGKSTVTLNLSAEPKNPCLAYGAIVHTITGFVPEVQYIVIKVNDVMVEEVANAGEFTDGLMRSEYFSALIGDNATLYFPVKNETSLAALERTMPTKKVDDPRALLEELIKGPSSYENTQLTRAFASSVTADDVAGVTPVPTRPRS